MTKRKSVEEPTPKTEQAAAEASQPQGQQAAPGDGGAVAEAPAPDLAAELEKARAEAAEYLDGWQRARAEFANYRKRVEREREESFQDARNNMLIKLLPVIDDLERAMANVPAELADHPWVHGIRLIEDKFNAILDAHGLQVIDPLGETFDPTRHQAVGTDDSSQGGNSGQITAVVQKGYACGDRVLRPALVRVAN